MNAPQRRSLLGVVLLASLAATRWVASQDAQTQAVNAPYAQSPQQIAARAREPVARAHAPAEPERLELEKLHRAAPAPPHADVFAASGWEEPRPRVSAPPAPPPAPTAPPLPFKYFGRMSEAGSVTVFLTSADRNHAVRVGDVLDGRYRIENISESTLVVTYLPLQQQQTLQIANR